MLALLLLSAVPLQMPADGWVAFDQPAVQGTSSIGCGNGGEVSLSSDDDTWRVRDSERPGGYETFTVFIEMRNDEPREIRSYTPDCEVRGAERATRIKLEPADAVALLSGYLEAPRSRHFETHLIAAIAHIAHEDAGRVLAGLANDLRDEDRSDDALFWLAQCRGDYGRKVVASHLAERWPLDHREQAVMALALSGHPDAVSVVRDVARQAESATLRARAVTALGITDAPGALADLHSIFLVDEDDEVREQAIFGLAQLDSREAAQILAGIIRDPRYGEHRRTAFFWLAQMDEGSSQDVLDGLLEDVF